MAQETFNSIHSRVTQEYLDKINPMNPPSPNIIEEQLLEELCDTLSAANGVRPKDMKLPYPKILLPFEIAMILAHFHHICLVNCGGSNHDPDDDVLVLYQDSGVDEGIYVESEDAIRRLARQYHRNMNAKEFDEVLSSLRDIVPHRERCISKDLIAVNNGIFDYSTKTLMPFNPELVFLAKSRVNYNPNATNVVIHNSDDGTDWDVESWMETLSDDPEIVQLLWQILGAIIRPGVSWDKAAWMYSEQGSNGKGTLCTLMRNLCGPGSHASIPISDFGKEFMLEPLTRATAIIVDENDVGTFIDKSAALKTVITNDVLTINRKFKKPISYQFYGFMVQCLNEFPRIKDKSQSIYRRQLFIPMTKCFTGVERKYIKYDYLYRPEVLEYVMKRVLHMNYYTLSEPEACKAVLAEYKEYNDPVREFWHEFKDRFVWDLLPFPFLYDLFVAWFRGVSPSGTVVGRQNFQKDLIQILESEPDCGWKSAGKSAVWVGKRMDKAELLLREYDLKKWMNADYRGENPAEKYKPSRSSLSENYRGLIRIVSADGA